MSNVNVFEPYVKNKPIEEVLTNLESLMIDIKGIKSEIVHIKEYIRKLEVRKQLEEEKEKQERIPLLKVLGLDKESVKNRIIKQAEDFVSGKRTIFSAKQFNDWLEETKGIKFYKVKKENKQKEFGHLQNIFQSMIIKSSTENECAYPT